MKNLSQILFEKLHINKHISISTEDDEKKYVIHVPASSPEKPNKKYLIYQDKNSSGIMQAYVMSFNELKDEYENNPQCRNLYVCKFNKYYADKLDDIKSGKLKIPHRNDLGGEGINFINNIINPNKI